MNKLITILCLLCGFAGTALHAQSEDEKIKEIIELAGTLRAFDQMSGTWNAQIEQIAMDSENKTKFKNILYKVFNIDSLKASYFRNYRKRYVKEKGDSLLVWMQSPLYAKFNEAERSAQTPEAQQRMTEFFSNCNLEDTTNARLLLAARLEKSLDAGNFILSLTKNFMRSFILALNPFLPEKEAASEDQINTILQNYDLQMKDHFKRIITASYLFTYRNLPLDEFKEYIRFYEGDAGQWENQTVMAAINDVFKEVAVNLAINIKLALPEEKSQGTIEY